MALKLILVGGCSFHQLMHLTRLGQWYAVSRIVIEGTAWAGASRLQRSAYCVANGPSPMKLRPVRALLKWPTPWPRQSPGDWKQRRFFTEGSDTIQNSDLGNYAVTTTDGVWSFPPESRMSRDAQTMP